MAALFASFWAVIDWETNGFAALLSADRRPFCAARRAVIGLPGCLRVTFSSLVRTQCQRIHTVVCVELKHGMACHAVLATRSSDARQRQ